MLKNRDIDCRFRSAVLERCDGAMPALRANHIPALIQGAVPLRQQKVTRTKESQVIAVRCSGGRKRGERRLVMDFPVDHIAHAQAAVLGGQKHLHPEDNFSWLDLEQVDVLFCARVLAGKGVTHLRSVGA